MKSISLSRNVNVESIQGNGVLLVNGTPMTVTEGTSFPSGTELVLPDNSEAVIVLSDGTLLAVEAQGEQSGAVLDGLPQDVQDEIAEIQQQILDGEGEITIEDDQATAAGGDAAAGSGSWSYVNVERDGSETIASAGFDTDSVATNAGAIGSDAEAGVGLAIDTTAPGIPGVTILNDANSDGIISGQELGDGIQVLIDLSDTGANPGDVLTVNGQTSTITEQNIIDGTVTITLPDTPADGETLTVQATITDTSGNTSAPGSDQAEIDTSAEAGTVIVGNITSDDVINAQEAGETITVTGSASGGDIAEGDTVAMTINGEDYTTTVDENGEWSVDVAGSDLAADTEFEVVVSSSDDAGNTVESNGSSEHTVDTAAPGEGGDSSNSIAFDDADDLINESEQTSVTFSGTVEDGAAIDSIVISDGDANTADITVDANDISVDGDGNVTVTGQDVSSLADGELTVTMTVTDEAGNQGSVDDTATLDTAAPGEGGDSSNSIAFDDADDLINESEQTSVTFSGTVEDGAAIDSIVISDGDANTADITVDANDISVDGDGNVTVTGQDVSSLADGELTVTMTVTDEAGNQGSVDDTATLDTAAPGEGGDSSNSIAFDDADDLINESEQTSVTFSGTVEDGAAIDSIVISDGDANTADITVDANDISVDGDGNVTVTGQDVSSLADGELTVTMTVTDEAGNQGSVDDTATLDTAAPGEGGDSSNSIAFDDADDLINESEQTSVTFSGTVEDGAAIDSIVISDGDANTADITVDANDISVDGDGNVTVTGQDVSSLADGELTVTMTVTDEAGNQGSVDDTATLDTAAPGEGGDSSNSIAFDDADDLINESEQTSVTFSGTVEDGAAIDSIVISDGDANTADITVDANDISVDGDGNVTVTGQDVSSLADGELTVTMTVTDEAGNQGSVDDTATLDTAAPGEGGDSSNSIAFDDADDLINESEQTSVTFSGTVEDGAAIDSIVISDGDANTADITVDANDISVDGDGNVTVTGQDVSSLADGELTVTMTVTDEAGNQGSVDDTATLDTAAPGEGGDSSNSIAFDDADDLINESEQTSVTFSGTVEDGAAIDSIVISDGDANTADITVDANDISVDGDGNVTVTGQDVSSLADGELTVTMTVTDEAGNQGSVDDTATLDTAAPGEGGDSSNSIAFDDADDLINESEQTSVTFSGTVEDGAAIDSIVISDGDANTADITVDANDISVDGDGNVTVTGQDVSSLADGELTVTMTVTDEAGNQGSVDDTATLDTAAPGEGGDSSNSIAFDDADDLINESEQTSVTFSGTVEDGAAIDSIVISDGDANTADITVDANDISVDGDGNVTVTGQDVSSLADGELTVTMTVTDEAGNQGSVDDTATLDTAAPGEGGDSSNSIAFDDADDLINESEQTSVTFSGTVEDGAAIDSIVISDGDANTADITVDANDISVDGDGNVTVTGQDVSSLADGELTVTMTVTDEAGNQGSVDDTATLDTAAPGEGGDSSNSIAFDDADDLINESEQTSVTFSGTVEDGAAIDSIVISDGDANTADITVDANDISVDGDGNVTVTGQDVSSLADGELTVTMTVTDEAGNQGSVDDTATLDTAAPGEGGDSSNSIAFDDADDLINESEQTSVTFSGTVEDGAAIDSIVISDGDANTADITVDANDISVDGDGNVTVTGQDVSSLADGELTVTMTVTDEAGNQGSVDDTATLDTAAPGEGGDSSNSIAFDDADDLINESEQTSVTFSGTVEDGAAIDSIVISDGDANTADITVDANDISVDGDGNVTVTGQDVSSLADGELTVTMTVTDEAGNQGSVDDTATLDTAAPGEGGDSSNSIAFDDADDLINESEQTSVTFSGTVEDGAAIDSIVISDGDANTADITVDANDISVDGDGNVTVTGQDVSSLADGELTVTMTVTDEAGNQGSVDDTATLDTAAPGEGGDSSNSIAFDDADDLINESEQTSVTFSGTVEDGAAIDSIVISDGDANTADITVDANDISVDGDGNVTVTGQDVSSLADGELTVTMTVTDEAGNQGSVDDTATLDTAAPGEGGDSSNSIAFDDADDLINESEQTSVTFSGTVEDGAAIDSIVISDGDANTADITVDANDISVDGDGNVTVTGQDVSSLADGELTVTMTVTDEAGNQGSVDDTATLDTAAPGEGGDSSNSIAFDDADDLINESEQTSVTFSGTVEDGAAIDSIVISDGDANTADITVDANDISVDGDGNVTVTGQDVSSLADGELTVTMTVTDEAGNQGSVDDTATLDTAAPGEGGDSSNSIAFDDADDLINESEQTSVTFSGTVEDGAAIDSIVISDGDANTADITVDANDISVDGDGNVTVTGQDVSSLADGELTVTMTVTDEAGNQGSVDDTATLDTAAPGEGGDSSNSIAFDDADDLINESEQTSVTFSGTVEDGAAIDSIVISDGDANTADITVDANDISVDGDGNVTVTGQDVSSLADGELTVTMTVTDEAGNQGSVDDTATLDTAAPGEGGDSSNSIAFDDADDLINESEQTSVTFSGTVEDGAAIDSIVISDGDANTADITVDANDISVDGDGNVTVTGQDVSSLADGELTVTMTVTDEAGNQGSVDDTATLDTAAPGEGGDSSNSIAFDDADDLINESEQTSVTFSGTVEDGAAIDSIVISDGDANTADITVDANDISVDGDGNVTVTGQDVSSLADGELTVTMTVTDEAGNQGSVDDTATLDTAAPGEGGDSSNSIAFDDADDLINESEQTSVTFSGTVEDGAAIDSIVISDGDANTADITVDANDISVDGDGNVTVTGQDVSSLADGELTVTMTVTDEAGNQGSVDDTATLDTAAPGEGGDSSNSIAFDDADDLINESEQTSVTFSGTVEDGAAIDSIVISDGDANTADITVDANDISVDGDGNVTVTGQDVSSLADGELTVTMTVTDEAGNQGSVDDTATLDTAAPGEGGDSSNSIAFDDADDLINESEQTSVTFSGTVEDGAAIDSIVISDGDANTADITVDANDISVDGDGNVTVTGQDVSSLADGELTVTMTVTDEAGNQGSVDDTATLDTAAPGEGGDSSNSIAFDDADDLINESEQTSVTFSGTVEDGAAIDSIVISDGDANTADITVDANDISVDGDGNVTVTGQDVSSLADGELTVTMTVTDEAGNQGSVDDTATLDTAAPGEGGDSSNSIAFDDADDLINESEQTSVTFSGTVEDGAAIDSIVISDGDANTADITVDANDISVDGDGNVTVTGQDVSSLADGELTVTMTVTDEAGNQGSVDDTATLDTAAPGEGGDSSNSIAFDDADDLINESEQTSVTFSGTVEDGAAIDSIVISDGDANTADITVDANDISVDGDGNVTVTGQDVSSLADGELTVTMTVTDEAGNQGSVDDTATLDTAAPGEGGDSSNSIAFDDADDLINESEQTSVTFSGTVEDGAAIDSIVISDGDANTADITVDANDISVDGDGNVTVTGQDVSSLADGELTVTMTVTDEAGNQGSVDDTATLDTYADAGTVSVNNITSDDVINAQEAGETITVTGSASGGDIAEGDTVAMTINGEDYTTTVDENGEWSVDVAGSDLAADTEFEVVVSSSDDAGNTVDSTATSTHTVDTTPSAPPVITNITDDSVGSDYSDVTMHGTGEPGETISIYFEGETGTPLAQATVREGGSWTVDLESIAINENVRLEAVQSDAAGNQSEPSEAVHYWHGEWTNARTETDDDYVLTGGDNDTVNIITGDANGQLVIDGGAGNDKAVFNASADNLSFSKDSNGYVIVENSDTGDRVELRDFESINIDGDDKNIDELFTPTVDIVEDADDDGVISSAELDGQVDVNVDLPAGAVAGDTISVSDGTTTNDIVLADTDITNGSVATSFDAPAEGETLTVTAVLEDQFGNTSAEGSDSAVLDTQIEMPTIKAIWGNDYNTGLKVEAEPNTQLSFKDSGGKSILDKDGYVLKVSVGESGQVTLNGDNLPDGEVFPLDITVVSTDPAGNTAEATAPAQPTLTLEDTGSSDSDGVTNQGRVTVDGIESGNKWFYTFENKGDYDPFEGSPGNFIEGEGTSFTLPEGEYEWSDIRVYQQDENGNISAHQWHPAVTVDTTAPGEGGDSSNSIAFDDADDLINESEQTSVSFSGTVEDGAAIDSIVISDGDANTADITVDANDISVGGDGKVTVTGQDVSSLADGELTVTMTVTDQAGNTGSVTDSAVYLASDGLTISASLSELPDDVHPADDLITHAKQDNPNLDLDNVTKTTTDTGKPLLIGGTSIEPYILGDSSGTADITFISQQPDANTAYYGGDGDDTVYLQGNRSDYGDVTQLDNQQGADSAVGLYHQAGHDAVADHVPHAFYDIETIYFADGKYQVDNGELTKVADIVQLDVDVTLNDNDGSEQITSVIISGIPEGGSVPDGEQLDSGDWQVPIDALQPNPDSDAGFSVTLELPEGSAPDLSVTVGAAEVDSQGNLVDVEIKDTASPLNVILPNEVTSNVSEPLTLTNDDGYAAYSNSFGYYVKDGDGQPTIGKVVWANSSNANKGEKFELDGYSQDEIGFFIIPNGGRENAISDQTNVTFEQNQQGNWQAVVNGQPLSGKNAPALFDQANLNPYGRSYMKGDENGDLGFEDTLGGGDRSFDDVNVNAEWGDEVTTVTGTIGDDTLEANQGNDILIGGTGSDKFQWSLDDMPSSADGDGTETDVIVDFDNQGDTQDTFSFVEDLTQLIKEGQVSISWKTTDRGEAEGTLTIGIDADDDSQMDQHIDIESLNIVTSSGGQQEVVINTLINGEEGELRLTQDGNNTELSVGDSQDLEIDVDTDW